MAEKKREDDAPNSCVPSLTRLSAERLLHSVPDLRNLDDQPKTILLQYLIDEHRIHADERRELNRLRTQIARMPAADREIHFGQGRISPRAEAGETSEMRAEIDVHKADGYQVNDYFLTQWAPQDQDTQPSYGNDGQISCDFMVLHRDSQSGEYRLCTYHNHSSNNPLGCTWSSCHEYGESFFLHKLIASPTLLYRLVVAFGLSVCGDDDEVDRYKTVWAVTLRKIGHGEGTLRIADYKGGVTAHFYGDLEACQSALKLVTWLVGDNIPHTYDGVLAGRIA